MNPGSHAKYQVPQAAQAWNVLDFFIKPVFWGGIRQNVIQDQGDETDHILLSMTYTIWLVVWNMTFIFPYIGNNKPNSLIFFRGVET